ncbi:hypothetical protein OXX59_004295 [Metschnikowia pulcherrima]
MIMSLHDPLSRKRNFGQEPHTDPKRARTENEQEKISEQVYTLFVKSAMESLEKNDTLKVNSLTAKISLPMKHPEAISLAQFTIVLRSLTVNVSKLDNSAAGALVAAIVRYPWLEISSAAKKSGDFAPFLDVYAQFLNVLVSSYPKYLHDSIKKLVRDFPDVHDDVYPHHKILKRFVTYIPTCINTIPGTLMREFPHHLSSTTADIYHYVRHCMALMQYCPDLQFPIWQMVTECLIKLDVELQNELDDLDDDLIEELINEEDEEIEEESPEDEAETGAEVYHVTSTRSIRNLVLKLDSSLELLLKSTENAFTQEQLDSGAGVSLYNTLTSLFRTHVLPTHFTKSVQFLMFHISQYQPELADSFLVLLIDVAFSPSETTEKRLKALQYLASYISRAKNLTKHQVVFVVSYLIGWINKYISEREHEVDTDGRSASGGMERFKLFYATFQALLYIFCFRHKQLSRAQDEDEDEDDGGEWESNIDKFFQRVIIARFNPLKYCDETVVYIFAKIATKLNVCYCYSIIEHNKRERMTNSNVNLPSAVGNFRHKQEFLDLEAYFPYDPMVLPNCKKLISVNYVEWKDVNPTEEDDEDDESGSHDSDSDDSDDDKVDDAMRAEDSDEEITSDEEDD